ncbi:MAG: MaoC family dehydratase N-terminal domain-containing protein [Kiloniellales bacterium]
MTGSDERIIGEWRFRVEAGKIAEFARALGADLKDPTIAPPTFTVVAAADFVERLVTDILKVDRKRTLHGEQSYEYIAPIRAGMTLACKARILSDQMKSGRQGGRMRVVTVAIDYSDAASGAVLLRETMTTIEKET